MRITRSLRSVSAAISSAILATTCVAALAACSSSHVAGPSPDGASPPPDGASGITYWMAPRTSEVDLQLVTTQPTQAF